MHLSPKYKPEKRGGSRRSWSSNDVSENTSSNRGLTLYVRLEFPGETSTRNRELLNTHAKVMNERRDICD